MLGGFEGVCINEIEIALNSMRLSEVQRFYQLYTNRQVYLYQCGFYDWLAEFRAFVFVSSIYINRNESMD
jgi:hypothetical protein